MTHDLALPSLFVSHGSPMIALDPGAAGRFMQDLGRLWRERFGRPAAIVTVSAHTAARAPVILAAGQHQAVYDFGNFDDRLFEMRYDAPGAPDLAPRVEQLLESAGLQAHRVDQGGLDHGAWTALRYLFPDADVPVLPLAFVASDAPQAQYALGRALAPLRHANVMVLGSGSMTHNLRRMYADGARVSLDRPEIPESAAFRDWFARRSAQRDWQSLFDYRRRAPHAVDMHPSDEHLLPWFVAAGASDDGDEWAGAATPQRLHASVTYGALGMDAYAFGSGAEALAGALAA